MKPPLHPQRLLVLVDFSEFSANLLRYAADWHQQTGAEVVLIHQTSATVPFLADAADRDVVIEHARQEALSALQALAQAAIPEMAVQYAIVRESLPTALARWLQQPGEYLILLGLKGTGPLRKFFIGSTAIEVIEQVAHTVVALPKNLRTFHVRQLHVAVSLQYPLNILTLYRLLAFVPPELRALHFFSVVRPGEDARAVDRYLQGLQELFAPHATVSTEKFYDADVAPRIKQLVGTTADSLLVVQKGSRLLTDHFFRRLLINDLVYEGETPMVILPETV